MLQSLPPALTSPDSPAGSAELGRGIAKQVHGFRNRVRASPGGGAGGWMGGEYYQCPATSMPKIFLQKKIGNLSR